VVYGRIAGDQEITAAKAAGINVLSLLWPAFLLGGLMSISSMILTDQTIPWAVANIQRTVASAMEDIFLDLLRSHHQVTDEKQGFSINVMGVQGKTLIKPTFQYSPQGHSPVTIQAAKATLEFDLEQRQVVLHLVQASVDVPGHRSGWFQEADYPFPLPDEISEPKPRHMSVHAIQKKMNGLGESLAANEEAHASEAGMSLMIGDFNRLIDSEFILSERGQEFDRNEYRKLRTEIFSRFAMSLSCFFFVLVGGPFAILQGRRQFLTSFIMCFLPILLCYYPVALLMMNLCKAGTLDPSYAMWLGNLLLGLAGLHTLWKVLRH
jgi:lipopolysaccharide export system permease protein